MKKLITNKVKTMGASAWIKFAQDYHAKHGGTYSSALKGAAKLWKKGSGSKAAKAEPEKKSRRAKKKRSKK